jgi:enamine deaminase RidA (YjgF/YER057c/UK114 family)
VLGHRTSVLGSRAVHKPRRSAQVSEPIILGETYRRKDTIVPREILNPEGIHPPPGYSHIAVATGTRLAFVAGQAALEPDFSIAGGDDLAAQTRKVTENLRHALDKLGAGWEDVVKATVYTTRPGEYETIGAVMAEAMGGAAPPAQVLLGVTGLALPELLIEIELVVSLP